MENRQEIIEKYRTVAKLPDWLFAFTFPLRRMAVKTLRLALGDWVLDLGCGSGASFNSLENAVGPEGRIVGADISPEMIAAARTRVEKQGWKNVELVESAAETLSMDAGFDGVLLFAMHDVLTSPAALDNILTLLKPGGRVAAVGPMLSSHFMGKLFNPLIDTVYKRFAVSQEEREMPWRLLAERLGDSQVKLHGPGILYLFSGIKR